MKSTYSTCRKFANNTYSIHNEWHVADNRGQHLADKAGRKDPSGGRRRDTGGGDGNREESCELHFCCEDGGLK